MYASTTEEEEEQEEKKEEDEDEEEENKKEEKKRGGSWVGHLSHRVPKSPPQAGVTVEGRGELIRRKVMVRRTSKKSQVT